MVRHRFANTCLAFHLPSMGMWGQVCMLRVSAIPSDAAWVWTYHELAGVATDELLYVISPAVASALPQKVVKSRREIFLIDLPFMS